MPLAKRLTSLSLAAFALALLIADSPNALAAGRFPYSAQVAGAEAQFRSGPGETYYPTSDARPGDVVEVYHEEGDWSAVRPPRGSHSWVSAKVLKLPPTLRFQAGQDLESPIAVEVGVANAAAFIGSEVSPDRDAVAVRLNAGERVYVLSAEPTEGQTWIKIAPPSGEFRWIETKHLKPKATEPTAPSEVATEESTDEESTDEESTQERGQATLAGAEETNNEPATNAAADANTTTNESPAAAASTKPTTKQPSSPSHPARGFWTQLQALELELSMTVAREPKTWRFDDIRRDAQNLYDGAKAEEEFDAARYLLAKLAQFESVRRERTDLDERVARRDATRSPATQPSAPAASSTAATTRPRTSLAGPPPLRNNATANSNTTKPPASTAAPSNPVVIDDARYDASGRLVAIPTRRAGAPSYAIVDERNNVRQYVSPAPNVNLQPYVGRNVGITGVAGPSPDSTRAHVMAKRIDVLDGAIRR